MTSTTTERLPPFSGGPGTSSLARSRDTRVLEHTRELAADTLAGRTVWCVAALPAGHAAAAVVGACLREPAEEGIATSAHAMQPGDTDLHRLTRLLDAMLAGTVAMPPELGRAQRDVFAAGVEDGEALLGADVRPGDVVVLHDALAIVLAEAVRARGAHAVHHVTAPASGSAAAAAWAFLHPFARGVDAYVISERAELPPASRARLERLSAAMPSPGHVSVKEVAPRGAPGSGSGFGWRAVLADVVSEDREEHLGGTIHARPAIPVR